MLPASRSPRSGGRWRTYIAVAAAVLVVATGGTILGLRATQQRTPAETVSTGLPGHLLTVVGIQMLSDTDGWAIGNRGSTDRFGVDFTGVVLHFDGYRWRVADTLADSELNSLSMIAATDGWIAGDTYHLEANDQRGDVAFLLHYSAGHWVRSAAPLGLIRVAVHMVTANFGWATGLPSTAPMILTGGSFGPYQRIAVYHNSVWSNTQFASPGSFDVWLTSPTEGWAVAQPILNRGAGADEFWHYTGGQWSQVTVGVPLNLDSASLEMTSQANGWAFGYSATIADGIVTKDNGALLLHYNGATWAEAPVPPSLAQHVEEWAALTVVSPTEMWIQGFTPISGNEVPDTNEGYLLHYANGIWSETKEPAGFYVPLGSSYGFDVLAAGSGQDVWIGGTLGGGNYNAAHAAIAHYNQGQWTIYT